MKENNKILFVCHGNICRSPMAEFYMKDLVLKRGAANKFEINSAATSTEEIGNDIHYGTKSKLKSEGIKFERHCAVQMKKADYEKYDYIIAMDSNNIKNILRIIGEDTEHKVYKLFEFAGINRDVADPWYTGDFNATFSDIELGCKALYDKIILQF